MDYTVIRSRRKTVAIQVTIDGKVLVRCPLRTKDADIQRLVNSKAEWIARHLAALPAPEAPFTPEALADLTRRAKDFFPRRVAYWAQRMGLQYGRITIRHQHSCWGSCSGKGNLNFNCLLMLAPENVTDYVIVHELCHLVQHNHSKAFWDLVAQTVPDYAVCRQWLKSNGKALIGRLP